MGLTHVVHYEGRPIARLESSFRRAREAAKLDNQVIPHILRLQESRGWMQARAPINKVAGFAGVSVEELQATCWHHHPDHQAGIVSTRMEGKINPARKRKQEAAEMETA